jgi:hypothetical protein
MTRYGQNQGAGNPNDPWYEQGGTAINRFVEAIGRQIGGQKPGGYQEVLKEVEERNGITGFSDGMRSLFYSLGPIGGTLGVNYPSLTFEAMAYVTAAQAAEARLRAPVTYLYQSAIYAYQWANPQFIPEQPWVNQMYNTALIDSEQWECWTRAHGNHPGPQKLVRRIQESKPNDADIVTLYYRGLLTLDEYRARMNELGYVRESYTDDKLKLFQQYPGLADQMRYMVRDSFDESVVAKYQYDKDFTDKFNAEAQKVAAATGIPERFFKLAWRAHWQIPSYTQLADVVHRFRPDRPERIDWENANPRNDGESDWDYYHRGPLVVTVKDMQDAMEVNDMAPAWVHPLIGIAYRPITNSDAARSYEIGTYSSVDMYHAFRDNGYDDANANKLVAFYAAQVEKRIASNSGVMTVRKIVALYKDGAIDRFAADNLIAQSMPDAGQRRQLLDNLDTQIGAEYTQEFVKLIRRRYMYGKYSENELVDQLAAAGVQRTRAEYMGRNWELARSLRSKEATVKQLCVWLSHNVLTLNDYIQRLANLGYDADDAFRISNVCKQDWDKATAKAADTAARRAKADARQAQRDAEAALRKIIKDLTDKKNGLLAEIAALEQQLSGQNSPPPPPPPPPPRPPRGSSGSSSGTAQP